MMKKIALIVVGLIIVLAIALSARFYIMGKQSRNIPNAGLENGQLQACPDRPSCVCSTEQDRQQHKIKPLAVPAGENDPLKRLAEIVNDMPRTEILSRTEDYMHVSFTSGLFRFVDDVEFLIDRDLIQVRSVSRVGYSDLGANRKRVEAIRSAFEK